MQLDFLWTLAVSLVLTLLLEIIFCLVFKIRKVHDLSLVVLVNVLTNPPVVLLNNILNRKTELSPFLVVIILELSAILIEGLYYKRYSNEIKRPFLFSLGANAFSFLTGLVMNQFF